MNAMIDNFRILPAGHCGSGSMRNLIYHYCGLDLEEGVVFGLGAGLDCVYFNYEKASPPFMVFGRGSTMEADLARTLGIDYTEQAQPDDDQAWEEVKAEVLAGRPTMLSGDIYYLDYRSSKFTSPLIASFCWVSMRTSRKSISPIASMSTLKPVPWARSAAVATRRMRYRLTICGASSTPARSATAWRKPPDSPWRLPSGVCRAQTHRSGT